MKGTLIMTDIPSKQLIMYLNDENDKKIVLFDLDDTRVFIDTKYVEYVKEWVSRLYEQNVFEVSDIKS